MLTSHFGIIGRRTVVPLSMTLLHLIGFTDWKKVALIEDESGIRVIRQEADLHGERNELHEAVIADLVGGNSRVLTNPAGNVVIEAVVKPLSGFRDTRMILRFLIMFQRCRADTGMRGSIIGSHVVLKHGIKLCKGRGAVRIKSV